MKDKLRGLQLMLLLFYSLSVASQEDAILAPVFEYKTSDKIFEELSNGSLHEALASSQLTFIGEYLKAREIAYDGPIEWGFDSFVMKDQAYLEAFDAVNAISYLIEESAKHQIVIINEAHHSPQHRLLTRSLLKGFYNNGYRYFALEALTNIADSIERRLGNGTTLNERGYPFNSPVSGTYTSEPQMSNLIREAIGIGFQIVKYEHFGDEREQHQAKNIGSVLENNPDAKILVHCGWYHLLEEENGGKRWMASYVKEYTGINPLTIYQDVLSERYSTVESPFYQSMKFEEPTLFVSESGEIYNGFNDNSLFDVLVYHPRTRFVENRPDWLYNYSGIEHWKVDDIKISYPCLVKAYKTEEASYAMPIDIIEKSYVNDPTVLCLPTGRYRLEISNGKGEKELREIEIFKSAAE